jgi:hypothetical protein
MNNILTIHRRLELLHPLLMKPCVSTSHLLPPFPVVTMVPVIVVPSVTLPERHRATIPIDVDMDEL